MVSSGGGEEKLCPSTASRPKIKLPKKIFDEYKTVGSTSVPRKLRTGIKKSSYKSATPLQDSKKSNRLVNGDEPLRKGSLKKLKMSMQNSSLDSAPKHAVSLPISKEEEEVAQTLFALSGMMPLNGTHIKSKIDGEPLKAKVSPLMHKREGPLVEYPVIPKMEPELTCDAPSGQLINANPIREGLSRDSLEIKPTVGLAHPSCPALSERKQHNVKVYVTPVNLQTIPPLLRTCDQRPFTYSNFYHTSRQPYRGFGLHNNKQDKDLLSNSESYNKFEAVALEANQSKQHAILLDRKHNGFTSRPLHASGVCRLPLQSSSIIHPSWPQTATSSSCQDTTTHKESCSVNGRGKSRKRSMSHVYASHITQVLKMSEGKHIQLSHSNQLRLSQNLLGAHTKPDHLNVARSEINKILFARDALSSVVCTNDCEAANQTSASQQEVEPLYTRCSGSKHQNMPSPFSMLKNQYSANPCQEQVAPVPVGLPPLPPQAHPYFGNPFTPLHKGNPFVPLDIGNTTAAQLTQLKQLQPQQVWSAQLAAQLRPDHISLNIANWQSKIYEQQSMTNMQALLQPSRHSREVSGAKYIPLSQQQSQLIGLDKSFPPLGSKLKHSHLGIIRDDNRHELCPNSILPMQFLCHEQP